MNKLTLLFFLFITIVAIPANAFSGEVEVVFVELDEQDGLYDISVTLRHADTGWEHYANWWRVRTEDGKELARRELGHPHVDEQPFERALFNSIKIPAEVRIIIIEGHDLVHEYGGKTIRIDLTRNKGEGYSIRRQ